MFQVTCPTVQLCTLRKSPPAWCDGMGNCSTLFSGPGMNPCQLCAGNLVMHVGSSCAQTSALKTGLSPHPLPNLPLHAIHITENRDFCPYMDAGVGGAWWGPCSASCPAQHGSTCTMFHKANILHMAPCLWLCSIELVPERKKSGGSDQRKCAEVSCSLFFCLLSPSFNTPRLSSGNPSSPPPPCTVWGANRPSAWSPKVRKNLQHLLAE